MSMARGLGLALLLAGLAGCFGGSSGGPRPAALAPLPQALELRVLWSADVGAAAAFEFSPALAGDAVYAAARDGAVVSLGAADGRERWRVALDARLSAGVGADAATVAVATDDGAVFALDAGTGKQRWRVEVSSEVLAAPRIAAGRVLVRSADGRIYALDEKSGARLWAYQRAPAALRLRTPQGLTPHEDLVFAGFSGGKLVALALAGGALRWEATVAEPRGTTELERVTDVVGDPEVVGGREVCAAAFQGRVACFDAQNGNLLWAREISSVSGVGADARFAFVADERGGVHALDRSNGRSLWKQDQLAHRQLSRPLPIGAQVALGDLEGIVHLLARDSGAFMARASTDGSPVRVAPLALPRGFLVQTQAGGLFALAP
ncbi:MAG: outer membrane protein assembly factor BamB [Betaproteobacteria bacterium]|nr:outer membrane protein assembly factor BamB [Betaproteobacteria bacterium]